MIKLTKRQIKILDFIKKSNGASNQEIKNYLETISRVTVVRDLNFLLENNLIEQKGEGRGVHYKEKVEKDFLRYIDIDKYFESDERKIKFERFNFDIIKNLC